MDDRVEYVNDKKPIMFGEDIPEGRIAGDCYMCGNGIVPAEYVCDCALEWVEGAKGVH